MARTQSADYDKKRGAITAHAAKLFALKGFASASVSDIAADCAVSKSLIYHYYPSKEAILFDVMNEHMDSLLGAAKAPLSSDGSPQGDLKRLTEQLLQLYIGAADHQKILLYELSSLAEPQREEIVQKERMVIARVESILERMAPQIDRDRLRTQTMLYFGMINWSHTWFKDDGALSRNDLAAQVAETVIGSLNSGAAHDGSSL